MQYSGLMCLMKSAMLPPAVATYHLISRQLSLTGVDNFRSARLLIYP